MVEWARELELQHERRRITSLQIAVVLWILAGLPVVFSALIFPGTDSGIFGVATTLLVVAIGLLVLIPSTWASDVARELNRMGTNVHGSGSSDSDDENNIIGVIAAIYWPLLTAIFLAWGFIGNAWDRSWIVWPIGAVLFGAVAAGLGAWGSYRKNRR